MIVCVMSCLRIQFIRFSKVSKTFIFLYNLVGDFLRDTFRVWKFPNVLFKNKSLTHIIYDITYGDNISNIITHIWYVYMYKYNKISFFFVVQLIPKLQQSKTLKVLSEIQSLSVDRSLVLFIKLSNFKKRIWIAKWDCTIWARHSKRNVCCFEGMIAYINIVLSNLE